MNRDIFSEETFQETRQRLAWERWFMANDPLVQAAREATVRFPHLTDRCYLCNRPFRTFERIYVVKVWADGQEGFYGDKRGKCESCREATFPPATTQWDKCWITRLR